MARSHVRLNKGSSITRSGVVMHWLGMLAMVIGLFTPLATIDAAAQIMSPEQSLLKAAQQPLDSDVAAFDRVVLVGDFQGQVGCADWDANCDQTRLQNINGFWTGVYAVPAGNWSWELIAIDRFGTQFSIDYGQVSVNEGQSGIYAEFNSATRDSNVSSVNSIAYANGSFGDIALAQDGDGFVANALNISSNGWVDMNVNVNGAPVVTGGDFQQGVSRVTFDSLGNITNIEHRGFAELTIQRMDAGGIMLPGSCFVVDGSSQSRGCDADNSNDGSGDGVTVIRFPGGFQPGDYTLRETRAADGAEQLEDQTINIQSGQSSVEARSAGEPTPELGSISVTRVDENGTPAAGSCLELYNQSGEWINSGCDDDMDGVIAFNDVPVGEYVIRETQAPANLETAADANASVSAGATAEVSMQSNSIPVEQPPVEEPPVDEPPVEEPPVEEPPIDGPPETQLGNLTVYREDDDGNRHISACFDLIDSSGNWIQIACDWDDGSDDGATSFRDLETGSYTIVETNTPADLERAENASVNIVEGDNETTVRSAAIAIEEPSVEELPVDEPPVDGGGDANASLEVRYDYDPGQDLLCIELDAASGIAGMSIPYACDNADNDMNPDPGIIQMQSLTPGDFLIVPYQGPAYVFETGQQPIALVNNETATASYDAPAPALSSFTVMTSEDGVNPVGEACFILDDASPTELCDPSGQVTFDGVEVGDYNLRISRIPPGFSLAEGVVDTMPISVDGTGTNSFNFEVVADTGTLTVLTTDGTSNLAGACYVVDETGATACDETGSGAVFTLPTGDYTVRLQNAPANHSLSGEEAQAVNLATDGATATFQVTANTGTLTVLSTDGTSNLAGACYVVDETGATACDESGSGAVFTLPTGDYTVRLQSAPEGYSLSGEEAQGVNLTTDGATATFQVATNTVDIIVTTIDIDTSELLGNACYTLDGGEIVCDDAGSGQVVFENQTPGEKTLSMETAPDGYEPSADQVIPAETDQVEVGVNAATGTLQVIFDGPGEDPVLGACVVLDGGDVSAPICATEADGSIHFDNLDVGAHTVTFVSAPNDLQLAEGENETKDVEVTSDGAASVSFALQAPPVTTGSLNVAVTYNDGSPATGACLTIQHGETGEQLSACDVVDAEAPDGVVTFTDVPMGDYTIVLQDGFTPERAIVTDPAPSASGSVSAGTTNDASMILQLLPTTGALEITVTDGSTNIADACVTVAGTEYCDNGAGDSDTNAGVILITDLEPNANLAVTMSTVPNGYEAPADQSVEIVAGDTAATTFTLSAVAVPGSVTVTTTDDAGDPLANACYELRQGSTVVRSLCDNDPADGQVVLEPVPAGTYRLVQTRAPSGPFSTADDREVTVVAGENTPVTVEMSVRPGSLRIRTVDATDNTVLLQNACYELWIDGALAFGPFCDIDDGNVDGFVRFTNVPAGDYELRQTQATPGFDRAENRNVQIRPAVNNQITVQNSPVQPPAESGRLIVVPLAPNGEAVPGGCYQIFDGDTPVTNRVCDNADDQPAQITFENVPVGDFTLREMLAPSPDWQIAQDMPISIANGETTRVEVPHQYKTGNVVIQAVNTVGLPLQGACFTLTDAGDIEPCTNATGQVSITGLTPGTRELKQTKAPFGFKLDETPREVIVRPGQTTTVRIVFQSEPPPNTGTLQVQKFQCPAGDQGERTSFLGGAQGNQELKQTAGCKPAVASFTLVAEDGSTESNAEFRTNAEGRAQLTAVAGIYLLTETDPDLPGNSQARLRIGVGQLTTVIVINYVAPPAPAPVTINVEGFTCAPGFSGSSFVDFQNSCMADSQLTNQITVRAEAANRYKRETGDAGVRGKTAFTNLPAGTYSIWAQRAHTVPVSYIFCGPDVNNPTHKGVNSSVSMALQSGTTIMCRVFQVPPLFDAEHGAIQVHKFNCPIDERQRGYDYQNECSRPTEPIAFEIVMLAKTDGTTPQPVRVSTNGDGIVQFPMLVPGTYKLTEVEGEWCFAQSNSVDAHGNVVVQKNKLSEVWVYNCVGTTSPPNTGSGDAAGLLNPEGGIGGMQVLPNLVWPAVLLAALYIWNNRKQA